MKIELLSYDYFIGSKILEKYPNAEYTDFAGRNITRKNEYLISDISGFSPSKLFKNGIYKNGEFIFKASEYASGIRLVMELSDANNFDAQKRILDDGTLEIEYGYYPQSLVKFEDLDGWILTGKNITTIDYYETTQSIHINDIPVIRCVNPNTCSLIDFCVIVIDGKCYKMEKVKWLVDPDFKYAVSKNVLVGQVPYALLNFRGYFDFANDFAKYTLSKEIIEGGIINAKDSENEEQLKEEPKKIKKKRLFNIFKK